MAGIILGAVSANGGWTVALVGYVIVFAALVCLILIFSNLSKLLNLKIHFELKRKGKPVTEKMDDLAVEGDVNAAISMALYMYFNEMHDDESNVITINRVTKRYSPWNSKIYNMNNTF